MKKPKVEKMRGVWRGDIFMERFRWGKRILERPHVFKPTAKERLTIEQAKQYFKTMK